MTAGSFFIMSFVISAAIGAVLIPRIVLAAKKRRLFDHVNDRTVHHGSISRLGGIAFYPAMIISFCVTMALVFVYQPTIVTGKISSLLFADLLLFFAGTVLIFTTGLYDDLVSVSYKHKFVSQFVAATMIVLPLASNDSLFGFFGIYNIPSAVWIGIMILVVVFVINAYNLIDGVDGLCAGISILSLLAFAYLFGRRGDIFIPMLAIGSIGVLLVFMRYNVFGKRMKIFMGDSGSMFLGYVIAFMLVNYVASNGAIINFQRTSDVFAVAFGAIFVPVFDALRLFIQRLIKGKSPFEADNNHIHHKFLSLGFSHMGSSLSIMFFHAAVIVLNIIVVLAFDGMATYIVLGDVLLGTLVITTLNLLIAHRNGKAAR